MEGLEIKTYVIDASVAVKWFVNEENSDVARKIKDAYISNEVDIMAPNLIYYEVSNALRFHPVARFSPEELRTILTSLKNLQFVIEPNEEIWFRSFNFSLHEGISIYDSVYLALASSQGMLVTADTKLLDMLSGKNKNNIMLLNKLDNEL